MSKLHFAYICLYQVFEYHMEFLETFGYIWSSKEVIRVVFGRALPGATSQSDYMRSLCTTSRSDSSRATARSRSRFHIRRHTYLTLERHLQVAPRYFAAENYNFSGTFLQYEGTHQRQTIFYLGEIHKNSLEKFISWILITNHNASSELATQLLILRHFSLERLKVDSLIDHLPSLVRYLITQGLEGQEELCFINNNGSWYKKEPNFQYNNYQQKSYPNNQQSGYPPRNNQQGSYQPQQNPSSGSSAPQESSTDTLLKQILESQTRSEKHVGYELKNLHTKIDGSYNELNNKFSHLASTVFEYHMEFLETFGCIWSSKEVIRVVFGRALPGATSQSDYMRSLCTTSRSDSSIAFSHPETHIFDRATC
ncbi:hypothetical protein IGI04_019804 [Brassica rapa subsp. trilocularis]|uniref:Uncharacterized protein n=1 Tax=Brassica rapa subsp. trilocularis TaxID=1813537 RepID=A0ABQ7MJA5_BRACM|nr:hypothetical protein IGI04_019804 [Brassica rapa subsp. trilocularis]